ncbi:hypothetical protein GJV08_00020 [Enterobacteriaceae bacterium RIT692]|nr:hypothetical protein [Enterobacteriaceae bacterium RIT692]
MDSAKEIARDMLEAMSMDDSGVVVSFVKGVIKLPYSLAYLGYDFIDTENRWKNFDDKLRFAELIKEGVFRRDIIGNVLSVFSDELTDRMEMQGIFNQSAKLLASMAGSAIFTASTSVNLGRVITSGLLSSIFSGVAIGSLLYAGAEQSRAVYTSRALKDKNYRVYSKLRKAGNLDLLYFIVKDQVAPFERACDIADSNPEEFKRVCEYFLGGL